MNLSFKIATRYLLGRKSTNAINLITWISILGMSIGTTALILILSVFNGFESLLGGLVNEFNPDLRITPKEGKYIEADDDQIAELRKLTGVVGLAKTLEEIALFDYKGSQEAGMLKGVDDNYANVTGVKNTIVRGEYLLKEESTNYAVMGIGMYNKLSINTSDGITPITAYMPQRSKSGPLAKDFRSLPIYPAGVFSIGSEEDSQLILVPYSFAENILGQKKSISALELKVDPVKISEKKLRQQISDILGENITTKNKYEQNESFLKIMNIEKWVSFLIVCLTLVIISFNIVGALWMIVLDKKLDISVLKSMGLCNSSIRNIFLKLGSFIGLFGYMIGIVFALILYWLQQKFNLVTMPGGSIIDSYPIELRFIDFITVFITVIIIATLASILPARRAVSVSAFVKYE